jgi:hypothetical protein
VKAVPPSGGNNDHVAGSTLLALPADPHQQTTVKHVQNFLAVVQDTVKGSYFDVSRQTIISVEGATTPRPSCSLCASPQPSAPGVDALFFIALEES